MSRRNLLKLSVLLLALLTVAGTNPAVAMDIMASEIDIESGTGSGTNEDMEASFGDEDDPSSPFGMCPCSPTDLEGFFIGPATQLVPAGVLPPGALEAINQTQFRMLFNFDASMANPSSLKLEIANPNNPADAVLQEALDIVLNQPVDMQGVVIPHILEIEAASIDASGVIIFDPNHREFKPFGTLRLGAGIESFEFTFRNVVIPASQIPEPSTLSSLLLLGVLGVSRRYRRHRTTSG